METTEYKILECITNDPSRFTITQIALLGAGFIFWTFAYILIVRDGRKNRVNEMPMLAATGNLAWEIIWTFFFISTPLSPFFNWGCGAWLFVDIFINYQILTKNRAYIRNAWMKENFYWIYFGSFFAFLFILTTMYLNGDDNELGVQSGLLLNVLMSGMYIYQLVRNPKFVRKIYTAPVAVLKMLGSGTITIGSFLIWPGNYYIVALGITTMALDFIYVRLFEKYKPALIARQESINSHRHLHEDFYTIYKGQGSPNKKAN